MKIAKQPKDDATLKEFAEKIMPAAKESGMLKNNPTFAIEKIDFTSSEVESCLSNYFSALYMCDRYHYEMVDKYPLPSSIGTYKNQKFLIEWANQLKKIIDEDFSGFTPSLGGSCLVIYNTGRRYEYLICTKDDSANAQSMQHVIPSFMIQPVSVSKDADADHLVFQLDLKQQMLRELSEEVFGQIEPDFFVHPEAVREKVLNGAAVMELNELIDNHKAELHATGLWLDLYRLRPEMSCVVIIHDSGWFNNHLRNIDNYLGNWEVKKGSISFNDVNGDAYDKFLKYQLQDDDYQMKFDESGRIGYLYAPGMAALIEGMKVFRNRQKSRANGTESVENEKHEPKSHVVLENKSDLKESIQCFDIDKSSFKRAVEEFSSPLCEFEENEFEFACIWRDFSIPKNEGWSVFDNSLYQIVAKSKSSDCLQVFLNSQLTHWEDEDSIKVYCNQMESFISKLVEIAKLPKSIKNHPMIDVHIVAKTHQPSIPFPSVVDVNGFCMKGYELHLEYGSKYIVM